MEFDTVIAVRIGVTFCNIRFIRPLNWFVCLSFVIFCFFFTISVADVIFVIVWIYFIDRLVFTTNESQSGIPFYVHTWHT